MFRRFDLEVKSCGVHGSLSAYCNYSKKRTYQPVKIRYFLYTVNVIRYFLYKCITFIIYTTVVVRLKKNAEQKHFYQWSGYVGCHCSVNEQEKTVITEEWLLEFGEGASGSMQITFPWWMWQFGPINTLNVHPEAVAMRATLFTCSFV